MMKKLALAVASSLMFSAGALAQTAPVALDAATAQAVRELMVATNAEEMIKSTMLAMTQQMPANMISGATAAINANPKLTDEQKKAEIEKVNREIPKVIGAMNGIVTDPEVINEMIAEMAPIYARHFTVDEIRQLTAMYRSPLGVKMLSTMPAVMAESMQISQKVFVPRMQKLMKELQAKK